MKISRTSALLAFLLLALLQGCRKEQEDVAEEQGIARRPLKERVYVDPRGYFQVLVPLDWATQEFPSDPRGKVVFEGKDTNTSLRVVAQKSPMNTFDDLMAHVTNIEKQFMRDMNIRVIQIGKSEALIRDVIMGELRILMVDILRDGNWHNLRYETQVENFTLYLPEIMECVNTYMTLSPSEPDDESRSHSAWSAYFLAGRALREGDTLSALFFVERGLELDPSNDVLLNEKRKLEEEEVQ
jgi:hypothetical protein